ncbi:MAG: peptide-methionine (S)-S-oxide reductase MsrA [Verrucomicrobia bacterium]|nr:peptide-methionine (S)-S-oxide reductase MsrA [Verrucomicrobiota bacterium]
MNTSAEPPKTSTAKTELATFGGGCFWCMEAVYQTMEGVKSSTSGYAGGTVPDPTYEQVCTGTTGHAEVIQVEFDPARISYGKLLETFWKVHDPTTLNRQGNDRGTQYRSVIFYHNEAQKLAAEKSKRAAQAKFQDPIVTQIVTLTKFYRAEDYHQDYYRKHPEQGYCRVVIKPKLDKLKKH